MVIQMEQIRNQMTELEKNPGPTQHIILDDLQKQMDWFKSQIEKKKIRRCLESFRQHYSLVLHSSPINYCV
jgi:hypothetical protein